MKSFLRLALVPIGLLGALLTPTPVAAQPEIVVTGNAVNIPNGDALPTLSDHTDFGGVPLVGGTVTRTFTIENFGGSDLNLTGVPNRVVISGPDAADFTVTLQPSSLVGVFSSTTFDVSFDPSALGLRSATISIDNDDSDENPFTFAIQGRAFNPNNGDLWDLTVSAGILTPAFSGSTSSYTINTGFSDSSMTVTPTRDEPNTTIQVRINGSVYSNVASGSASAPLPLNVGANTVDVRVTPQNPVYTTTYTITVYRSNALPGDLDELVANVAGDYVLATAVQPDGKIILAGSFTSVLGQPRSNIARLNADGTLDAGFDPKANNAVYSVAVQPDGKIVLGGYFTTLQPNGASSATTRNRIARVNSDGTLDTVFDPNASDAVLSLALQTNGQIVLGGWFGSLQPNGGAVTGRRRVARVNADGTLDATFDPSPNGSVIVIWSVAVQSNGKILLAGSFTSLLATPRQYLGRVNSDGTLDMGFDPKPDSVVFTVAEQPDGKILLGGNFFSLQPNGASGTTTRTRMARVNSDGTLDTGFDPNADNVIHSLALQANGKILLGGDFSNLQPNGASTPTPREGLARLNADGTVDTTFDARASNVRSVALQADGRVLIGGSFTAVQSNGASTSTPRNFFARLLNEVNLQTYEVNLQTLSAPTPSQVSWVRVGTLPEVDQVTFERSTDGGAIWTALGNGVRVGTTANWELTGQTLAPDTLLRARGRTVGGMGNAASGIVEALGSADAVPEIAVFGNYVSIANGDGTPSPIDDTDFGSVKVDDPLPGGRNFIAYNWGTADLTLGSVAISGPDAADFAVTLDPFSPVSPANGSSFGVEFNPSARGLRTAVLTFATDDSDENPFTFAIQGTGACPTITLGSLPNSALTSTYSASVAALGGVGPYTYVLTAGSLPPGLSLNSPGPGGVAGTPSATGKFTFEITATDSGAPFACSGVATYTVVIGSAINAGDLVISEFRFRGPGDGSFDGSRNEYVEIHNQTSADILVGGEGLTLARDSGTTIGVIPVGTLISARGFFLFASRFCDCIGPKSFDLGGLGAFPAADGTVSGGDASLFPEVPDGAGIALFKGVTLDAASRLDSVGFSGVEFGSPTPLYREGAGLTPSGGIIVDGEYAFVRKNAYGAGGGVLDTGNNANDFLFVAPDAGTYSGVVAALGGPSPERSTSERAWTDAQATLGLIWPPTGQNGTYNRITVPAGGGDPAALEFRRRLTNNTGQELKFLRFKVTTLTTKNSPVLYATQADLRPVTSSPASVPLPNSTTADVKPLLLQHDVMYQLFGTTKPEGGLSSTLVVDLSVLPGGALGPGQFVDVNFKVFIHKGGSFAYFVVPEGKP